MENNRAPGIQHFRLGDHVTATRPNSKGTKPGEGYYQLPQSMIGEVGYISPRFVTIAGELYTESFYPELISKTT
jgi:hypothetical protein